ncbi:hypothetical protein J2T08_000668 [Neorhizobium galegae]|uniref:DUF1217 domain-containing protein n=1 Tax=Neorhizobium galegae TaxID=399 RepID=UPI001AE2D88A|nr:DUF1217 domain-containing protein [Neorhizobium galegae]MBP2559928.1 hypothetical protein [Neorhizobium galegae]MDQ0132767.1 hypothetical protein [Neorhizobium galegae]
MITTYTSYAMISRDMSKSLERVAEKPEVARESEYYLSKIGSIKTVDDFMADTRVYNYALKAHGLEDMAYAKAFIRKVLTEGTDSKADFANQLSDSRYAQLAESLNFAAFGTTATSFDKAQKGVVDKFQRQTLEEDAGADNMGVRLALYFERTAPTIKSGMEVLADDALSEVMRTALGMSADMIGADLDRQAKYIEDTVKIADFQDPDKVNKFLERFTAMWEISNPTDSYDPLAVFNSPSSSGISTDLLISINNLKLGGK